MTEFEDKTRGGYGKPGYEYVILERNGPGGLIYGRACAPQSGWFPVAWEQNGQRFGGGDCYDLIPRITVSEEVMAEARRQFSGFLISERNLRKRVESILRIARDEWEAGR